MGRRNKLEKFATILGYENVIEHIELDGNKLTWKEEELVEMNGQWRSMFFKNTNPLVLELACGRGEYALQLGRRYHERNFLGVDIKGARIWKGATIANSEGLGNVGFLRTRIEQIDRFFATSEVDEVWITFPDPFHSKERKRLTSPYFLDRYRKIMKSGGIIHLKTDDDILYEYSLEVLSQSEIVDLTYQNEDIYSGPLHIDELNFKTYYETMHLGKGKTIKYLQAIIK